MQKTSRQISTNQPGLHPRLPELVRRHLEHTDQSPLQQHSISAYRQLREMHADYPGAIVLDSFCGTGHSTALLAQRHPNQLVVGIDKSGHRLARQPAPSVNNYLLLQARCEDIWRLLAEASQTLSHHYIFYPNPWPKSAHIQRRIHGHSAFPTLLRLGGQLEVRSNWQTYVEELGVAAQLAGQTGYVSQVPEGDGDISLFERKYRQSGHTLWRFRARLGESRRDSGAKVAADMARAIAGGGSKPGALLG